MQNRLIGRILRKDRGFRRAFRSFVSFAILCDKEVVFHGSFLTICTSMYGNANANGSMCFRLPPLSLNAMFCSLCLSSVSGAVFLCRFLLKAVNCDVYLCVMFSYVQVSGRPLRSYCISCLPSPPLPSPLSLASDIPHSPSRSPSGRKVAYSSLSSGLGIFGILARVRGKRCAIALRPPPLSPRIQGFDRLPQSHVPLL